MRWSWIIRLYGHYPYLTRPSSNIHSSINVPQHHNATNEAISPSSEYPNHFTPLWLCYLRVHIMVLKIMSITTYQPKWLKMKKIDNAKCCQGCGATGILVDTTDDSVTWSAFEKSLAVTTKAEHMPTLLPGKEGGEHSPTVSPKQFCLQSFVPSLSCLNASILFTPSSTGWFRSLFRITPAQRILSFYWKLCHLPITSDNSLILYT